MKQPNWMTNAEQYADALFGMAGNIITAFISRLAPFVVPLAPAFFFAHSIYGQVMEMTDDRQLALALGAIAAAGLEIVGIMAAHRAVDFYSKGEAGKAQTAVVITAVLLAHWHRRHCPFREHSLQRQSDGGRHVHHCRHGLCTAGLV